MSVHIDKVVNAEQRCVLREQHVPQRSREPVMSKKTSMAEQKMSNWYILQLLKQKKGLMHRTQQALLAKQRGPTHRCRGTGRR
jgi:hypothetical protein